MLVHVVEGCPRRDVSRAFPGRPAAWFARTIETAEMFRLRLGAARVVPATVDDLRELLILDRYAHAFVPTSYLMAIPGGLSLLHLIGYRAT